MNVLFLTQCYEPEITAATYLTVSLAKDLSEYGSTVNVIAQAPVRGIDEETVKKYKKIKKECTNGICVRRLHVPFNEKSTLAIRIVRNIMLLTKMFFTSLFVKSDVIISYSTPPLIGFISVVLGFIKRIPVAFYLQDIFPDSLINSGAMQKSALIHIGQILENLTYKMSRRIIVISDDFRKILISRGISSNKIDVVYNWSDSEHIWPVKSKDNILYDRYNIPRDSFIITYCGNIGLTQNLELAVDVIKSLEDTCPELQFILFGDGSHCRVLKDYINNVNAKRIMILPYQSYDDLAHVFSLGNVSLVISKPNISKNSFPSKTWSIMSASTAVIASFDLDSELTTIISRADCGLCVQANDFESLKSAISYFYENRDDCRIKGSNGYNYLKAHLTREESTKEIDEILHSLVQGDVNYDRVPEEIN